MRDKSLDSAYNVYRRTTTPRAYLRTIMAPLRLSFQFIHPIYFPSSNHHATNQRSNDFLTLPSLRLAFIFHFIFNRVNIVIFTVEFLRSLLTFRSATVKAGLRCCNIVITMEWNAIFHVVNSKHGLVKVLLFVSYYS